MDIYTLTKQTVIEGWDVTLWISFVPQEDHVLVVTTGSDSYKKNWRESFSEARERYADLLKEGFVRV